MLNTELLLLIEISVTDEDDDKDWLRESFLGLIFLCCVILVGDVSLSSVKLC